MSDKSILRIEVSTEEGDKSFEMVARGVPDAEVTETFDVMLAGWKAMSAANDEWSRPGPRRNPAAQPKEG